MFGNKSARVAINSCPSSCLPDEIESFGEEIKEWRGEYLKRNYLSDFRAFPQVRQLIEALLKMGKKVGIASSANADELDRYKEIAEIADLIPDHKTASADDAEKSKPHPDIFLAALKKLEGIQASETIAIGDTPYDAEAAAKAGIKTIGVLCGGFEEAELRRAGCIAIYRSPADLLAHLDVFSEIHAP